MSRSKDKESRRQSLGDEALKPFPKSRKSSDQDSRSRRKSSSDVKEEKRRRSSLTPLESAESSRKSSRKPRENIDKGRKPSASKGTENSNRGRRSSEIEEPLRHHCPAHLVGGMYPPPPDFYDPRFPPVLPHPLAVPPIAIPPAAPIPAMYTHPAAYLYAAPPLDVDPRLHWSTYVVPRPQVPSFPPSSPGFQLQGGSPATPGVDLPNPWSEVVEEGVTPPLFEPKPSRLTKPPARSALKGGRRASLLAQSPDLADSERSYSPEESRTNTPNKVRHSAESPSNRLFEGSMASSQGSNSRPHSPAGDVDSDEDRTLRGSDTDLPANTFKSRESVHDKLINATFAPSFDKCIQEIGSSLPSSDQACKIVLDPGAKSGDFDKRKSVQVQGGELWQYCAAESAELVLGDDSRLKKLRKELANLEKERDDASAFIKQLKGLLITEEKR